MLIFLDVESTGLEELDKICSLGIVTQDKRYSFYDLVDEGKKISPKASSINHITNDMLKGMPSLKNSDGYKFIEKHNNTETTYVVHNLPYISKIFSTGSFTFKGTVIDTRRCLKHLVPECEEFSLDFLRYELKLYKDIPAYDNSSLCDSLHVRLLYEYLLEMKSHDELVELTCKNVLLEKFEFGKYSGRHIEEIAINDRGYLEWMLDNLMDLDDDFRYSIEYYLGESL